MRIKKIRFIDEVRDEYNDSIDVGVEFEDGYSYIIVVRKPNNLMEEMLQEKTNFIQPLTEAIKTYAEGQGYWLKLCQFGDKLDIAILTSWLGEVTR